MTTSVFSTEPPGPPGLSYKQVQKCIGRWVSESRSGLLSGVEERVKVAEGHRGTATLSKIEEMLVCACEPREPNVLTCTFPGSNKSRIMYSFKTV